MNALKPSMYGLQYTLSNDDLNSFVEKSIIGGLTRATATSFGFMFSTSWAEGEPFGMVFRNFKYSEENNED